MNWPERIPWPPGAARADMIADGSNPTLEPACLGRILGTENLARFERLAWQSNEVGRVSRKARSS